MFSHAELRREALDALRRARVPFFAFAGWMLLVCTALNLLDSYFSGSTYQEMFSSGPAGIFVFVLTSLIAMILEAGRVEYCDAALLGERAEYGDLFVGFSFVFRFISTMMLQALLLSLGFSFFLIPGILLFYRYRFSLYILCEDPSLSPMAVLRKSHEELKGFKQELFLLDLSLIFPAMAAALPQVLWTLLVPAEAMNGVSDLLITFLHSVMTYPAMLLLFYRTALEMTFRKRILQHKYPAESGMF